MCCDGSIQESIRDEIRNSERSSVELYDQNC